MHTECVRSHLHTLKTNVCKLIPNLRANTNLDSKFKIGENTSTHSSPLYSLFKPILLILLLLLNNHSTQLE